MAPTETTAPPTPAAAYNIFPVDEKLLEDVKLEDVSHGGTEEGSAPPEVRVASFALASGWSLLPPPPAEALTLWQQHDKTMDILSWLGSYFGFQADNVKNQREHVVLLLANYDLRMSSLHYHDRIDASVLHFLRRKTLKNYTNWCSFLNKKPNLRLPKGSKPSHLVDECHELLYTCLYLLIWGEAANLRFMPECLCFIFHNMASEFNKIIESSSSNPPYIDEETGLGFTPCSYGHNNFLSRVIEPIYNAVKGEAEASNDGKAPHSVWRNYDDMNEYFWSDRCFTQLSWPPRKTSNYLITPQKERKTKGRTVRLPSETSPITSKKVGKTGYVEQRSFWNIFRSFDHLWIGLILVFQFMMILAFNGDGMPWNTLYNRDVQGALLTIFITWSGLRAVQSILDAGMQYSLVSRETKLLSVRMFLKSVVAFGWIIVFSVMLARIWQQRVADNGWSLEADRRVFQFSIAVSVFVLPEMLGIVLFVLPWIRNFVEKSEWRIFHALTWWFHTRSFVGRGLREGIIDTFKYTLFWVLVLSSKFFFSYFLQVRPMVEPTRQLLNLQVPSFEWHEFFSNQNRFVVLLLWAPVVLIYTMDIQIWYSVFSSGVGALIGLSSHIGEIRNVEQLKLRFPFFASAVGFNLMPEEEGQNQMGSELASKMPHHRLLTLFRNMVRRVKLRYGLTRTYTRKESLKFTRLWNEIIHYFREEDLVSDHEVDLLEIPLDTWNVSVMLWPSVLLSNEVLVALGFTQKWHGGSMSQLWAKICKNEYRRCAVIESYESLKHMLLKILREDSQEHGLVEHLFWDIEEKIRSNTFGRDYKVTELVNVHARVVALVKILLEKPNGKAIQRVVDALQNLYEVVIRDFHTAKQGHESLRNAGLALPNNELLFLYAVELPNDDGFYHRLRRMNTTISTHEAMNNVPKNLDARRRITFFSNSLFMNMPRAPTVEKMLSFSVLTPYYSEDVMYTKEQLRTPNEDGVTILFYLQSIYPDEWNNFLERKGLQKMENPEGILWKDHLSDLRLWASYRGQTLARTVRGMMYYQRALETLAVLDGMSEDALKYGMEMDKINTMSSHDGRITQSPMSHMLESSNKKGMAAMKFTYVAACQIYGSQKQKRDTRADDILFLMKQHAAMRVAYVDEAKNNKYYSVLVKYDRVLKKEVEVYRIQLPGPLKLGEGKPENQNHALIFTRGDGVQTIDMNQDNYFEEALKMRNLLQEFTNHYGLKRPQILGVREHVFTGSVSSLAWFMSAQEASFVTLGQRVLANPLKVRMHYGHPDVFDRLWFLTRGGISKASRVINISEDIFAGFNCTLRGGNVTHHEYIQVGKGRDVGFNQIALFEAKVSSGNGEQVVSRDVYRLGHRLDFFRMLSFYHTTVGFYINNMIVVLTVYAFLWGRVYLALSGLEDMISGSLNSKALGASLNQQFVVQLGLFTALPMLVENVLEMGFSRALWDFLTMQLELCSLFFTFSLGTKSHYFGRTLLHGGAKYRATGRGFVVKRERFAVNYRLYARSHFVKGVELIVLLIIYEAYGGIASGTFVYIILTFSTWFLALTWIMAPFVFNPTGFDWLQTVYDFEDFQSWLWHKGGVLTKSEESWEVWWNEEHDHLRTTDFWGRVWEIFLSLRFFLIQYGMVYRLHITNGSKSVVVYFISWVVVICAMALCVILGLAASKYAAKNHLYYRSIQLLAVIFVAIVFVLLAELTPFQFIDLFLGSLAFVPTGWGLLSIALVLKPFLSETRAWPVLVSIARLYELAIAIAVLVPLAIFSWMPGFQAMQTRILFNQAFSRGLQMSRIVAGKKIS